MTLTEATRPTKLSDLLDDERYAERMVRLSCGHTATVDADPSGPADEEPDGTEPSYCPRCGAQDDLSYAEWLRSPAGREAAMWANCPNTPALAATA